MIKINNIVDLSMNAGYLPLPVFGDVDKRITDWLASGGNIDDGYVRQQLRYAERVINLRIKNQPKGA